jgi:hypothetical protein
LRGLCRKKIKSLTLKGLSALRTSERGSSDRRYGRRR